MTTISTGLEWHWEAGEPVVDVGPHPRNEVQGELWFRTVLIGLLYSGGDMEKLFGKGTGAPATQFRLVRSTSSLSSDADIPKYDRAREQDDQVTKRQKLFLRCRIILRGGVY